MQKLVLLLEPDRVMSSCIKLALAKIKFNTVVASSPDEAIKMADKKKPYLIISELSLSGHSGTEFLYELRTYSDWSNIPLIVHSSIKLPEVIAKSKDWKLLGVNEYLYKSDTSLKKLVDKVAVLIEG